MAIRVSETEVEITQDECGRRYLRKLNGKSRQSTRFREAHKAGKIRLSTEELMQLVGRALTIDSQPQPRFDLFARRIKSAETLGRWFHPARRFVPLDKFIPMAVTDGLIHDP